MQVISGMVTNSTDYAKYRHRQEDLIAGLQKIAESVCGFLRAVFHANLDLSSVEHMIAIRSQYGALMQQDTMDGATRGFSRDICLSLGGRCTYSGKLGTDY